jgi:hypothetical protein
MPGIGWVVVEPDTSAFASLLALRGKLILAPEVVELAGLAATESTTEYAADVIRSLTPVGAGRGRGGVPSHYSGEKILRDSWITKVRAIGPEYQGSIINRKAYAAAVESGARPRTIEPKPGNTRLRWPGMLSRIGYKSVNWPGFAGRHMGSLGLDAATPGIVARYRIVITAALKGLFG